MPKRIANPRGVSNPSVPTAAPPGDEFPELEYAETFDAIAEKFSVLRSLEGIVPRQLLVLPNLNERVEWSVEESPQAAKLISVGGRPILQPVLCSTLSDVQLPKTCSEAIAMILALHLRELRNKRNTEDELVVARAACVLLESRVDEFVLRLIRNLLKVTRIPHKSTKRPVGWKAAVLVRAKWPQISQTALADRVRVNKSTISRWLKDPAFLQEVKRQAEIMEWAGSAEAAKLTRHMKGMLDDHLNFPMVGGDPDGEDPPK